MSLDLKLTGTDIRQLFLDNPEIRQRLAEGLALLGISDRIVQRVARAAYHARAQLVASDVQRVKSDDVPFANLAQQVFFGYAAIVQDDGCCG